jgi:DNA-binding Xre family transcriptional regulator
MIEVRLLDVLARRPKGENSLYWLEKTSGVTYNTLHAFANGKRVATDHSVLDRICAALDCQVGEILVHVPGGKKKIAKH